MEYTSFGFSGFDADAVGTGTRRTVRSGHFCFGSDSSAFGFCSNFPVVCADATGLPRKAAAVRGTRRREGTTLASLSLASPETRAREKGDARARYMVNFPTAVALFFVGSAIATVLPRPLQEDRRATTGYKKHKRWKGAGGGAKKTTTPTSSSGSGGGAKRGRGGGSKKG